MKVENYLWKTSSPLEFAGEPYNLIVQQKNGDLRLSAYNKKREIESNSGKHYIAEANGNPKYLFRLEVRVNGDTLREYFQHLGIEYNPMLFCNEDFLWRLFLDFSNRVLRFQTVKGKQTLDVLDIVICYSLIWIALNLFIHSPFNRLLVFIFCCYNTALKFLWELLLDICLVVGYIYISSFHRHYQVIPVAALPVYVHQQCLRFPFPPHPHYCCWLLIFTNLMGLR